MPDLTGVIKTKSERNRPAETEWRAKKEIPAACTTGQEVRRLMCASPVFFGVQRCQHCSWKKTPAACAAEVMVRSLAVSYFRMGSPTLSSALSVFTSEFEMGSGGSRSLWPPGKLLKLSTFGTRPAANNLIRNTVKTFGCYFDFPYPNCLGVIWSSLTVN